ncbi:unnamed protein product [Prorocentrum cordatum]|uniref:Uncharacterized protein n=1 Tax=Prorocentrum cordatum TaxID=2364126 RepID=A0ABN9TGF3_9DINO|nr:unnamed protein product [Polarella glacialis]
MLIARLCRVEFFQPAGRPRQPGHETDFAPPPAECRQQHLPESRACPSEGLQKTRRIATKDCKKKPKWLRGPAVQQRIRLKLGRAPQHVERVRPASAHPRGERREEEEEEKEDLVWILGSCAQLCSEANDLGERAALDLAACVRLAAASPRSAG